MSVDILVVQKPHLKLQALCQTADPTAAKGDVTHDFGGVFEWNRRFGTAGGELSSVLSPVQGIHLPSSAIWWTACGAWIWFTPTILKCLAKD